MQKQHPYAILIGPIWRWSLWKPNTAELCGWMNSKKAISEQYKVYASDVTL